MSVSVPTRGAGDLGPALSNVRAPVTNELSAVHVEKIKDHLIEQANAINAGLATCMLKFSGSYEGDPGTIHRAIGDGANEVGDLGDFGYPVSFGCTISKLKVKCLLQGQASDVTVTVYRNGTPTAIAVTLAPGASGVHLEASPTSVAFAEGDTVAVVLSSTAGGTGTFAAVAASVLMTAAASGGA